MENVKANHSRFKDAPWYPKQDVMVMIGGAGGIGSWTALLIARAGFIPIVFDFDMIEEHNMGGQLFSRKHINNKKVIALQSIVKEFTDTHTYIFEDRYTSESMSNLFTISAFDNMQARKDMYEKWEKEHGKNKCSIFIDGRLQAEHMQIFCVQGGNEDAQAKYKLELFDDSEIEDAPCTMKQTSHAAAMIASHIVGFFTNFYANLIENDTTRVIPDKWEYFIPLDYLEKS